MATKRTLHVVGTGAMGEPLISLLLHTQRTLDIDEITFHKHSPRLEDRPKVNNLIRLGARLAVDPEKMTAFEKMDIQPEYTTEDALAQATVVLDCAADGLGLLHKSTRYEHISSARGFIAQGSEFGFGKMYARGINDAALVPETDRFLHVVSCNTHNLAVLIDALALHEEAPDNLIEGRFVCMRRASDVMQHKDFIAAPDAGAHQDSRFGTHHARDAWHLFHTRGLNLNVFSSAIKLNSQYMHSIWFNLLVQRPVTLDEVIGKLEANPYIALTHKIMTGPIFSFGRDHGYCGRLLNQAVVSIPTLIVRDGHEITGFCFTPQDGNSLLSSVAAAAWLLDPDAYEERLHVLTPLLCEEI